MIGEIYIIKNIITNKVYIGQTTNVNSKGTKKRLFKKI
jgi:predicted GIY-YIG superfamily endonuclease